jgi:hypothetical protein
MSASEYGGEMMRDITVHVFVPKPGKRSCTTETFCVAGINEETFNSNITPLFQELCASDATEIALYNSERVIWLDNRKPDFHLKHAIFNNGDVTPHNNNNNGSFLYGGVSKDEFVKEIVFVFEGKVSTLANTEFASMISYLFLLSQYGHKNPIGLLYNHEEWMLFQLQNISISRVVKGKWTDEGSFDFLFDEIKMAKEAFTGPLTEAVLKLCSALNVEPSTTTPLLGMGANGYAFRVKSKTNGNEMAMKVVVNANILPEYQLLKRAYDDAPDFVVTPMDCKIVELRDGTMAGAYTMLEVGSSVHKGKKTAMISLLSDLHKRNLTHGDARSANIIQLEAGQLKWIDFRLFTVGNIEELVVAARIHDVTVLLRSLFPHRVKGDFYISHRTQLEKYANGEFETFVTLSKVWMSVNFTSSSSSSTV